MISARFRNFCGIFPTLFCGCPNRLANRTPCCNSNLTFCPLSAVHVVVQLPSEAHSSDTRSAHPQALAISQQAEYAEERRDEPKQHVDQIDPVHLRESNVIILVGVLLLRILNAALGTEPPEDSAPDEEQNDVPGESDGNVVIANQCWNNCERDGGDDAQAANGDGEALLCLPILETCQLVTHT